jgi:OOP family OmpA-OmpF porin
MTRTAARISTTTTTASWTTTTSVRTSPRSTTAPRTRTAARTRGSVIFDDNSLIILDKIYFETNSAQILSRSFAILDAVAATLIGNPQIRLIEVQGHADERGNDAHNLQLTQDRAASVVEALVQRNVPRDRLRSAGYGELCPVNPASNRAAYEENRRVEFKVIETDEGPTGVQVACDAAANLHQR